jgi:endo-1,3-1,4-beta-glycanase ExoK
MRTTQRLLSILGFWGLISACDTGSSSLGGAVAGAAGHPDTAGSAAGGSGGSPASGGSASGAGSPASGGSSTAGGGGSGPASTGSFALSFRDDFDQLDTSRWQLMTHSWDTNLALFSDKPATVEEGQLVIRLLPAPEGTVDGTGAAKPYLGAEVRSVDTVTYGRVRARIKFAKGSAVVSSLVTIYTPWPADDWNELDFEVLGASPPALQLNTMVYLGPPPAAPGTTSVTPTQAPFKPTLGFDPTADFHVYAMEWTPESARFLVDDEVVHTWTEHIDRLKLPQNVLLTLWASSSAAWAGPVTEETLEAEARYDWVEFYDYVP